MVEPGNDDLQRRAGELYRKAISDLDQETIARLEKARHSVINELSGRSLWTRPGAGHWVSAAVAAGCGALAIGWLILAYEKDSAEVFADNAMTDDIEIMLAGESLDLLEELDFYLWLATQPDAG